MLLNAVCQLYLLLRNLWKGLNNKASDDRCPSSQGQKDTEMSPWSRRPAAPCSTPSQARAARSGGPPSLQPLFPSHSLPSLLWRSFKGHLVQRFPTFVALGTRFVEDSFSMDWGGGMVSGWFKGITFIVPFSVLITSAPFRSSGIRSWWVRNLDLIRVPPLPRNRGYRAWGKSYPGLPLREDSPENRLLALRCSCEEVRSCRNPVFLSWVLRSLRALSAAPRATLESEGKWRRLGMELTLQPEL